MSYKAMAKENAKKVSIDEVRKIQSTLKDLFEALTIHAEEETNGLANGCAKKVKTLLNASKSTLAALNKVKAKRK